MLYKLGRRYYSLTRVMIVAQADPAVNLNQATDAIIGG